MISASTAQAQSTIIDENIFTILLPEQSEQSAKRTLRSVGFIMQSSDIEDNIKKLTYSNNSEEWKHLQVSLYIKNETVFKVEWKIKSEKNYLGKNSEEIYNLLESQLDAMCGKTGLRFEKIKKQTFYRLQNTDASPVLFCQIMDSESYGYPFSVFIMTEEEGNKAIDNIMKQEKYQAVFQPYLDKKQDKDNEGLENELDKVSCYVLSYIIGDINQDGADDCIIHWAFSFGGPGYSAYALLLDRNGEPELKSGDINAYSVQSIDDQGIVHSIKYEYLEDDPRCCPSIETKKQFQYVNEELIEINSKK
jgi:hypothetical protein